MISFYWNFFFITACDESNSCDFSACYDDIEFTKVVIDDVSKMYCIDMDSIHMSGISNGGMFMYYAGKDSFYALALSKKYFKEYLFHWWNIQ